MKLLKLMCIITLCTTIHTICMQKKTLTLPPQTGTPQSHNPFDILATKSFDNFSLNTSKKTYKLIYNFLYAYEKGQKIYEEVPEKYWDAYQCYVKSINPDMSTLKQKYGINAIQKLLTMANNYAQTYKKPTLKL